MTSHFDVLVLGTGNAGMAAAGAARADADLAADHQDVIVPPRLKAPIDFKGVFSQLKEVINEDEEKLKQQVK